MYFRPQAELPKSLLLAMLALVACGGVGMIELADLQIVDANPLESLQPLGRPSLVMIGGAVVRYQGKREK
jgi:hypothetical protein